MSSTSKAHEPPEESKREESSTQQNPTAPPAPVEPTMEPPVGAMGPPPTYSEAIGASPYPAMSVPATAAQPPYPTSAPYPVTNSSMPLPVTTPPTTAPYPVDASLMPLPEVHSSQPRRPMGFHESPHTTFDPIVDQPTMGGYHHPGSEEFVHPKTYVVLQDDRSRRRDDEECSCMDGLMCCVCCMETCRCVLLCLECAAACSK